MKLLQRFIVFLLFASCLLTACEKEYSLEDKGNTGIIVGGGTSEGTLGGDSGTCSNAQLKGLLGVGIPVTDSNQLIIEMNFSQIGTYYISTDTVNGIYFSKTGTITATGATQIALSGSGTPTVAGVYDFTVSFKGSYCNFNLSVYEVATATSGDYFPTTAGSSWTYISSDPGASASDTFVNVSSNAIVTINGNPYTLITSSVGLFTDSLYFQKGGGDYHQFGDLDVFGVDSNVITADYIFLKDNVAVGAEWESPEGNAVVDSIPTKIKLKFAILEKNVNVLLGNKIYKDVIKVSITEQVQLPTGWTPVFTYETWYAKGIGIINVSIPVIYGYGYQIQTYNVL